MSGDDYGGDGKFGRGSFRGRRGGDRTFSGGRGRGKNNYSPDDYNSKNSYDNNADWEETPSKSFNDRSTSSYSGGGGKGYNSQQNFGNDEGWDETPSQSFNDRSTSYSGSGGRGYNKKQNSDDNEGWEETPSQSFNDRNTSSYSGGGGYRGGERSNRRNFDDDESSKMNDSRGSDRFYSRRGAGRSGGYDNRRGDEDSSRRDSDSYGGGDDNRRNLDRYGGGDDNRRNSDRYGGGDNNRRNSDRYGGGDDNRRNSDRFGDSVEYRRGGGNAGERRGRSDRDSQNGFSRRNDDDSPNRNDGERRGGRDGEGDKDEKPRERYIPPDPTDDENVMFGSGITSGINFSKYESIQVQVSGENPVPPILSFEKAGLREIIFSNVKKSGYKIPTPIQKYALPTIMMGRDLMACAQTGSGKTAAYLIPMINTLLENPSELIITSSSVEPQAVILSPTRELAIQIFNEARKFSHGSIIKVAMAYGGTVSSHQASVLMRGCHILVATPGRLNDFVSRGKVKFSSLRYFVLDEADRMLDMGFKPEIEKMLNDGSMVKVGDRQSLMFSATFPEEIQRLAQDYLHNYLFVTVGIVGGACADVQQIIHEVARFDKKEKLKEILRQTEGEKTLVFVEQKRTADFIAALLSEANYPTTSIHGDRLQSQREAALNDFKTGRMPTLVATAVAARGLDIKNVSHVINFDLPNTIEEYVHRIGRTGRVGNRGKATSFYDPNQDSTIASQLVTILKQTNQTVPDFLSSANDGASSYSGSREGQGFGGKDFRGPSQTAQCYQDNRQPVAQEEDEEW